MELVSTCLGPWTTTFFVGVVTFFVLLWYSSRNHSYWKKKGVPFVKPYPLVGSFLESMFTPQHEVEERRYKDFGPIYGHYEGLQPALSVADPKLLRDILVKDFPLFVNRRSFDANDPVVDNMVTNLTGENWKQVRTIITPTFTTGKLKRMIGIFKDCSMTLVKNLKDAADKKENVNVKKYFGTMSMDVIASSAFSTKIDSHNDPENQFVQISRKTFLNGVNWRFIVLFLAPKLMKIFKIPVFKPDVTNFFRDATLQIISERKRLGQTRNDFLQLLMDTAKDVAKTEKWEDTEKEDLTNNYGEAAKQKVFTSSVTRNLSMDEIVAQCIIFFIAGYDTVTVTLTLASYLLALNPETQEKARQEIRDRMEETNGELTYDAIQKMKYLDNIISETLRLYPAGIRLERKAEVDYKLGETGITIPKNMIVTIPVCAIHKDPKYFPDPETFNPDRFTPEERAKREPFVYMPFGVGHRNCIGMRFALLETKVCLIYIISHFNIKACAQTMIPLKFNPSLAILLPKDVILEMEPRNDSPLLN